MATINSVCVSRNSWARHFTNFYTHFNLHSNLGKRDIIYLFKMCVTKEHLIE